MEDHHVNTQPEGSGNPQHEAQVNFVSNIVEQYLNTSLSPIHENNASIQEQLRVLTARADRQDRMQQQIDELMQRLGGSNAQRAPESPSFLSPNPTPGTTREPSPHTQPREVAPNAYAQRRPLPLPSKFSGKRNEYTAWAQQMRDKITLDTDIIGGNAAMWYTIYSCLESAPQSVVSTFYASGGKGAGRDPAEFMSYLDATYLDKHEGLIAMDGLRSLRQRENVAFGSFLPKFENLLSKSGGSTWSDNAKISFLEGTLNAQLRQTLVAVQLPEHDYRAWVTRVQEVAARLDSFKKNAPAPPSAPSVPAANDGDGDVQMSGVNRLANTPSRGRKDIKAKTTEPPKETRKCFRCGKAGHLKANCRQPPKVRKTKEKSGDEAESSHSESSEDEDSEN